ncbi:MAG: dTMP kinase [Bacilli bacterium]|nr:dTMP kinase [Bacilli bacterium]MBN2876986.1 dTMP kinase [Bacilli bacterium]
MKGKFISFEGPDGSGKTSIIKIVEKFLKDKGYDVLVTREPGGISISEKIRDIIHDVNHTEMDPRTEALLYAASRSQHLNQKIKPALLEGKIVLCDRYVDSSLAYQGIGRHLGLENVLAINMFAIDSFFPDLTIFVDVRPEIGLKRVFSTEEREKNRLDLEPLNFHEEIYQGYLELIKRYPNRIKKINGEQDKESVASDAIELIETIL